MIEYFSEAWMWLALAFIIGLLTAWWIWSSPGAASHEDEISEEIPVAKPLLAGDVSQDIKSAADDDTAPEPEASQLVAAEPMVVKTNKKVEKPASKNTEKPKIPDNLELLKGVGPKLNALLKSLGVTTFDQVANWSAADVKDVDSRLGSFAGRITRDNWVDQAKLLSKGDVAAFEKKYGSLGAKITR